MNTERFAIIIDNGVDAPARVIAPAFPSFDSAWRESTHVKGPTHVAKLGAAAVAAAMRYCELHHNDNGVVDYSGADLLN